MPHPTGKTESYLPQAVPAKGTSIPVYRTDFRDADKPQSLQLRPEVPAKHMHNWNELLNSYKLPTWDELPTIDLYMDQVTTFMSEHFMNANHTPDDKILTKTMINNNTG